jgi:hypothetical protein
MSAIHRYSEATFEPFERTYRCSSRVELTQPRTPELHPLVFVARQLRCQPKRHHIRHVMSSWLEARSMFQRHQMTNANVRQQTDQAIDPRTTY